MRFIAAVAKIAAIFLVGNFGLGYQDRIRGNDIWDLSTQLYHVMGLGQVDASGADFVSQKSAGVEPEKENAFFGVIQKHLDCFLENIQALVIKIDLNGLSLHTHVLIISKML